MELRHLRYFVAVVEEGSLTRASARLRIAQPALSRQIRQLELKIGVTLFERSPKGVTLTAAGEAFLVEARRSLEHAAKAELTAREVSRSAQETLRFAHGLLFGHVGVVEDLLGNFRASHPEVRVTVASHDDATTHGALVGAQVDVGCVFSAEWPPRGFEGHRLREISLTGVLLPSSHPLTASPSVSLGDLRGLPLLDVGAQMWPGFFAVVERALRSRGLEPKSVASGPVLSPFVHIAAGSGWTLATEKSSRRYRGASSVVVYRPFQEPPIPLWLSLVWHPPAAPTVERLVAVARGVGLDVAEHGATGSKARHA